MTRTPYERGCAAGYDVEMHLYQVSHGHVSPDVRGPRPDEDLFVSNEDYRRGLSDGRARFIDERLTIVEDARDHGYRGAKEPSPIRDNGPYETREQAGEAMAASLYGIPINNEQQRKTLVAMQIRGALLMTGVVTTAYEDHELDMLPVTAGTEGSQVITGWIMRAWLAGHQVGQQRGPAEPADDDDGDQGEGEVSEESWTLITGKIMHRLRGITAETLARNTGRPVADFGIPLDYTMADVILAEMPADLRAEVEAAHAAYLARANTFGFQP